jgi:hypothetical protein
MHCTLGLCHRFYLSNLYTEVICTPLVYVFWWSAIFSIKECEDIKSVYSVFIYSSDVSSRWDVHQCTENEKGTILRHDWCANDLAAPHPILSIFFEIKGIVLRIWCVNFVACTLHSKPRNKFITTIRIKTKTKVQCRLIVRQIIKYSCMGQLSWLLYTVRYWIHN